ncbi:MAG: right-handed parallel beta-helix repeat-containing protein, partial [Bacteroidota bacterium]
GITAPTITIASGANSGTMTFSASASASVGGPTAATLTATSGGLSKTVSLSMTVTAASAPTATFNLSASPTSLSIVQGQTGRVTLNIARVGGFAGIIRFAYDRLPTNARASFNPARTTTTGNSSILTFTIARTVATGSYTVNVSATSGTITRRVAIPLTIISSTAPAPNFTVSRSPTSLSLQQGASAPVTVTLARTNGFTGAVTVTASGLRTGVTAPTVTIPSGSNSGSMTFSASGSASVGGPTTVTLTAVSGSLSKTTTVALSVTAAPVPVPPPTPTPTPTPTPSPSGARHYDMGTPTLREIWVSTTGNDANSGATRALAKRTLASAWASIPNGTLTGTGYRIAIASGSYAETTLPNYMDLKHGTAQFPIIIQAVDGRGTVTLGGDLNVANVSYVYLIDLNIVPNPPGDVVHFEQTDHMLIRGVTMNGGGAAHETLKVNQSQHIYIEESDLSGTYENAIDYVAVQYGHIVNSKLHNAGDWCAYAKGGSAYLWVEGNEFYNCGTGGFTAGQGTGFEYMTSPWLHYEAYGITFVNNVIHDTEGAGIGVNGGYNIVMAYNTMYRVGQRSHVIEAVFGGRTCDQDQALLGRCGTNLAAGGWGATGSADVPIPNKNVYIYNNIVFNPPGYQSQWQHFAIYAPRVPPTGSNVPSPARTDVNLNIKGNIIWNGSSGMSLGVEDSSEACASTNPTCNVAQLTRDNAINTIQPQLVSPATGNFQPVSGGNIAGYQAVPLPTLSWTDLPARPLAPAGYSTIVVSANRNNVSRSTANHVGAY